MYIKLHNNIIKDDCIYATLMHANSKYVRSMFRIENLGTFRYENRCETSAKRKAVDADYASLPIEY